MYHQRILWYSLSSRCLWLNCICLGLLLKTVPGTKQHRKEMQVSQGCNPLGRRETRPITLLPCCLLPGVHPHNLQGEPWEEAGIIITFPILGQAKEEVEQTYLYGQSSSQTPNRNRNPLLQFDFLQISHQILSKSVRKSAPVHVNRHRHILPVLLRLCAFRERS